MATISDNSFKHLLLSSAVLLGANAYFLFMHHNVPDGRILFMLPVTSIFVLLCALCFNGIRKKLLATNQAYLMTAYITALAVLFLSIADRLQMAFPDMRILPASVLMSTPSLAIFPFLSYIGILGAGLIIFLLLALIIKTPAPTPSS